MRDGNRNVLLTKRDRNTSLSGPLRLFPYICPWRGGASPSACSYDCTTFAFLIGAKYGTDNETVYR